MLGSSVSVLYSTDDKLPVRFIIEEDSKRAHVVIGKYAGDITLMLTWDQLESLSEAIRAAQMEMKPECAMIGG